MGTEPLPYVPQQEMLGTHSERDVIPLTSQLRSYTRNGQIFLDIAVKPERTHRARYNIEGSRGVVRDETGISHPIIRLIGYNRPAKLLAFIGTGSGDVAPHPYYQACYTRNYTVCAVREIENTVVLEMNFHPDEHMSVSCDCMGIIKLRKQDVEQRMQASGVPEGRAPRKSSKARLVFRTTIMHPDGSFETIQIASDSIECTQQLSVPELLTMSWRSCPANGGLELFMIGTNFSRDCKVAFYEGDETNLTWRVYVYPIREFFHRCHLVCVVPPYLRTDITEPVQVRVVVECAGNKSTDPQPFAYTPVVGFLPNSPICRPYPHQTDFQDEYQSNNASQSNYSRNFRINFDPTP